MAESVQKWLADTQAPLLALLRPGVWIPGARFPHVYQEKWEVESSPLETMEDALRAIELISDRQRLQLQVADRQKLFVQVFSFTRSCRWLDVVELSFSSQDQGAVVDVQSFSSGVLPAWLPLAPLWNAILCWIPFSDVGLNEHRLLSIRDSMQIPVTVQSKGRRC